MLLSRQSGEEEVVREVVVVSPQIHNGSAVLCRVEVSDCDRVRRGISRCQPDYASTFRVSSRLLSGRSQRLPMRAGRDVRWAAIIRIFVLGEGDLELEALHVRRR